MSKYVDLTSGMVKDIIPVTPSDTVDISGFAVGLYITVGGTISFVNSEGTTRNLTVPSFYTLTCLVKRVNATGTAATGIHAYTI